jgi:hypothetical protein
MHSYHLYCKFAKEVLIIWLILLSCIANIVISTSAYNCTFIGYANGTIALPARGQCRGPLDYTIAKRNAVRLMNRGCDIDKIPILSLNGSEQIVCGDCIPGTHGNYAFFKFNSKYMSNIVPQSTLVTKIAELQGNMEQLISDNPFTKTCPINYFCNSNGKCQHMKTLPNYHSVCVKSKGPLATTTYKKRSRLSVDSSPYSSYPCGGLGLQCIAGSCVICQDDQYFVWPVKSVRPNKTGTGIRTFLSAYCVNGEYVTKDDLKAFWNVYHMETIFFMVLFAVVSLRALLAGPLSLLLRGKRGIAKLKKYIYLRYWEKYVRDSCFEKDGP